MAEQNYIEEIKEVWEMVKTSLKDKFSETAINLWLGDIRILSFETDVITMGIDSELKFKIVQEKYVSEVENAFSRLLGYEIRVHLTFTGSSVAADRISSEPSPAQKKEPTPLQKAAMLPNYNFEYTFENFIVGSTNKFAQAACISVANNPATNYNPLFIYGNSGLGKTHLMYATINRLKQNNPNINIIYTKGEDFVNEMVACLSSKTMEEFREKYRKCDVLMIDDIQFIAGKTGTQEEFFHTFNALYEWRKQIILTSDRPPCDIKPLEDRLKTRFEWGLLADIEPPDLELRVAIIKKKAEQVNVVIPNDVLTFLGENLRSNIRQIEGAIKKLGALTFLSGRQITMDLAHDCISELLGGAEPVSVTVEKIFSIVNEKYGVSKDELAGPKRNKDIAAARHICIFLIREMTEMSFPNIGKLLERDHTTVMSSYNNSFTRYQLEPMFTLEINELKKELSGE